MGKRNTFFFQGTKTVSKELNYVETFYFNTEVIVCGSLAHQFTAAIDKNQHVYDEEEMVLSFMQSTTIDFPADMKLNLISDISYKDTRERINHELISRLECPHNDRVIMSDDYLVAIKSEFTRVKTDWNSMNNTWVVLATKNKEEQDFLLKSLETKLGHRRFKVYMQGDPESLDHKQWVRAESFNAQGLVAPEAFAEHFAWILKSDVDAYVNARKEELIDKLVREAGAEIVLELRRDAADYFNQRSHVCTLS